MLPRSSVIFNILEDMRVSRLDFEAALPGSSNGSELILPIIFRRSRTTTSCLAMVSTKRSNDGIGKLPKPDDCWRSRQKVWYAPRTNKKEVVDADHVVFLLSIGIQEREARRGSFRISARADIIANSASFPLYGSVRLWLVYRTHIREHRIHCWVSGFLRDDLKMFAS